MYTIQFLFYQESVCNRELNDFFTYIINHKIGYKRCEYTYASECNVGWRTFEIRTEIHGYRCAFIDRNSRIIGAFVEIHKSITLIDSVFVVYDLATFQRPQSLQSFLHLVFLLVI